MLKTTIICLLVLMLYMGVFAQSTFDVFTYAEPIGFTKANGTGYISYTKSDNAKGTYCILSLYGAGKSPVKVLDAFNNEWKELVATPLSVKAKPATEAAADIDGWKTMTGTATFDFNGGKSAAMLFCFVKNGIAADVLAVTNSNEYENDLSNLLESIILAEPTNSNNPNSILVNTAVNKNSKFGGGISGVWVSYTNDFPSTTMTWNTRVFFNNGTFLESTPYFGCINFKEDANNKLGTYKLNGSKGTIKMPVWTNAQTIELVNPTKLKIGSETFIKSDDVNGKTINATFTSYTTDNFADVKAQPIGDRSVINFYSNGTFYDEGIFKYFAKSYDGTNDSPGKGTYTIKEYTIELKYNDSRVRTTALATCFGASLAATNMIRFGNGTLNKLK